MKRVLGIILLLLTVAIIFIADSTKFGIPAIGKLLSPTHGVWKNGPHKYASHFELETPEGKVDIYYDDRKIPHLFAPNESALYYAQGYVQANDRLWQMDFQTRIAGGNLAAAIGKKGLSTDRYIRRLGLPKIAQETHDELKDDSLYQVVVSSFSNGVNAYINQLKPKNYPIEFKLTNYAPEPWTEIKSILLLKLMALRLSGHETDVANTNTINLIGRKTYDILFPDFPMDESPIIPKEKNWNFDPVAQHNNVNQEILNETYPILSNPIPHIDGIGSNNWAIGKDKTADGSVIVCNDPHLWLSYPSIWYEMQLNAPDLNVYGVTIPGAPCITIGFNENIAWGITNGGRDVKDWYSVQYKDDNQKEYLFNGGYETIEERIETIHVNGGKPTIDTVKWTKIGPIVYDENFGKLEDRKDLAMHWLALLPNNEMKTLYQLNIAKNHNDYFEATKHFDNPGQNFVFGDVNGNVAIKATGLYRARSEEGGKFVERLEDQSLENLNTYIPKDHNPHILNPSRGFVSSANQQPTDSTYPYYYNGDFETYRNRRINSFLDSLNDLTIEDMMRLQNDNYNLMAAEILPFLLENLESNGSTKANSVLDTLKQWDFYNEYTLSAPTYFQIWWKNVMTNLWDEMSDTTIILRTPRDYYSLAFLKEQPDHNLIDNMNTKEVETVKSIISKSFEEMLSSVTRNEKNSNSKWSTYNGSKIQHLMELSSFSSNEIEIGGSENSPNANNGDFGPSWRMIVKLDQNGVEAYGVYPGGQSGNPTDYHYDDFVEHWRTGQYFKLNFFKNKEEASSQLSN